MGKLQRLKTLLLLSGMSSNPFIEKEGASLHCVKIEETENNSIEYYG